MVTALAIVIISGTAADSLGCIPSDVAHDRQDWVAQAVREPSATQTIYGLLPGQPFSFNFTVSEADTYTVRVWGRNSAGDGCQALIVSNGREVTAVYPRPIRRLNSAYFDLMGRRVWPYRSGRYFGRDSIIVR